jgi:hypothetical protein
VPGVLELTGGELLHPARASATTVSAGRTAPVHLRRDRDIIPTSGWVLLSRITDLIMTSPLETEPKI